MDHIFKNVMLPQLYVCHPKIIQTKKEPVVWEISGLVAIVD